MIPVVSSVSYGESETEPPDCAVSPAQLCPVHSFAFQESGSIATESAAATVKTRLRHLSAVLVNPGSGRQR